MHAKPDLSILPGGRSKPMVWRALGRVEDLDLVLGGPDRPLAVTRVLHACALPEAPDAPDPAVEPVWQLTLAARIGGLLAIWSQAEAALSMELALTCPEPGCAADLEVALPVADLLELARAAEAQPEQVVPLPGGPVTLRRPTGADQRRWRAAPPADAEAGILAALIVAAPPGAAQDAAALRAALEEALAAFDPLPCFSLAIRCPDCGQPADLPVDLEAELLARLARLQDRLFAQVDTLARRYGWSDARILAMPPARRARYIAMADAEGWS